MKVVCKNIQIELYLDENLTYQSEINNKEKVEKKGMKEIDENALLIQNYILSLIYTMGLEIENLKIILPLQTV